MVMTSECGKTHTLEEGENERADLQAKRARLVH